MLRFKEEMSVLLLSDIIMNQEELTGKNHVVVEGIVSQQSKLIGKTNIPSIACKLSKEGISF